MAKLLTRHYVLFFLVISALTYLPVLFVGSANPDAQFILPNILSATDLGNYLENLLHLRTIDVQPFRDLSLFLDIFIYQKTGINTFVFHNVVLWALGLSCVFRISKRTFPNLDEGTILLLCSCFLVYPLFTSAVAWGVARKHLLAFLFTLLATELWCQESPLNLKKKIFIFGFYLLAVLSQPIGLLWPLWAFIHSYTQKKLSKSACRFFVMLFSLMILLTAINYIYYSYSPVFKQFYGTKTDNLLSFPDKLLALGHYSFQLVFPYLLSYRYELGHWSTLLGLVIMVIFCFLLYKFRPGRSFNITWLSFALLPLTIVASKPDTLYDTYLLLPAVGCFMLILQFASKANHRLTKVFLAMLLIWGIMTNREALAWKNDVLLTQRSFARRPSCKTAADYLKTSYENGIRPESPEAKLFLHTHECKRNNDAVNLHTYLLYYESDLPLTIRFKQLEMLRAFGIFPSIALASLYVKTNLFLEADKVIEQMVTQWGKVRFREEFIPIVKETLFPYCEQKQNAECTKLLSPFIRKKDLFFYR